MKKDPVKEEIGYLKLAAEFMGHQLYWNPLLKDFFQTADGANLWDLIQEGLGEHDDSPQVPLSEIILHIKKSMKDNC